MTLSFVYRLSMALILLPLLLLSSCEQSTTSFEIIRVPSLSAEINGELWVSDRVEFEYLGPVVYFGSPTEPQGELFERIVLVAFEQGSDLGKLEITLDVKDPDELLGNYSTNYEEYGGLHSIEWLEDGDNSGEYRLYSLCDDNDDFSEFVVERQSRTEEIVSGSFRAVLCERLDANDQLEILDGVFRDLEYSEED